MELEISPEPSPEDRQAIAAALAELKEKEAGRGPWWEAGLPAEEEDED